MGSSFEGDRRRMFEAYVYDYLLKKNCHTTAELFVQESNLTDPTVPIDTPEGFLSEWWSLFYDIYFKPPGGDEVAIERSPNLMASQTSTLPYPRMFDEGTVINSYVDNSPSDAAGSKTSTPGSSHSSVLQHQLPSQFQQYAGHGTNLRGSTTLEPMPHGGPLSSHPPPCDADWFEKQF